MMEAWSDLKKKTTSQQVTPNSDNKIHQHHKSDIFHALVPITYVSKVCGILPVKFTPNKGEKYSGHIDPKQVSYGFLLIFILVSCQSYGLYRDARNGLQNSTRLFSKTAVTVTSCDVLFVICVTSISILGSPTRWNHLRQGLDKIVEADEKLDVATSKHLRKRSIVMIACTFIYLIGISAWDYFSWGIVVVDKGHDKFGDKGPINYCPLYVMYTVIVSLQMQYAVILLNLGERFAKLNRIIENLTKTNEIVEYFRKDMGLAAQERRKRMISQSFVSPESLRRGRSNRPSSSILSNEGEICGTAASETIDHLITVHEILCDSIIHINKAYGVILMLCTLSCLTHYIITLYFLWAEINSPTRRWYVFTRQTFWVIFHSWKMMLFVQPPYLVASKARNTGSLVSQALASNWNPPAQKQLERFTMQLLHRPVEFTACGLFYLDRGLITSIAGAVTTYLVILVQFQNYDDQETRELLQNATDLLRNISGIGGGS